MFRRLKSDKDTYITNRIINNSRVTDANVGRAGTLDLFKLYGESNISGSSDVIELSRILIHFDLDPLRALTGSILDIDSDFKATIKLKNVYGGDTVPSNFTLAVFPLSKSFDEGIGRDIGLFRDLDSANFLTASVSGAPTLWSISGANDPSNDYLEEYGVYQVFSDGTEDLNVDVTTIVSATLAGDIPDEGFRISFSGTQETDEYSRFVKRFGSRNVNDLVNKPSLDISFDDSLVDERGILDFDTTSSIYVFNYSKGQPANFFQNGQEVSGNDSIILRLVSGSQSRTYTSATLHEVYESLTSSVNVNFVEGSPDTIVRTTGSWISEGYKSGMYLRINDTALNNKTITIKNVTSGTLQASFGDSLATETDIDGSFTGSILVERFLSGTVVTDNGGDFFEKIFTGSQYSINDNFITGVYCVDIALSPEENSTLQSHVALASSASFTEIWGSLDGSKGFITGSTPIVFNNSRSAFDGDLSSRELFINFRDLRDAYKSNQRVTFSVFVQDPLERVIASRLPLERKSLVFTKMYYQIIDANSGDIIIPFETENNGTKMSSSDNGMYFDLFMDDLDVGRVYGIEVRIDAFGKMKIYDFHKTGAVFRVDP